jgi:hypothetical protein
VRIATAETWHGDVILEESRLVGTRLDASLDHSRGCRPDGADSIGTHAFIISIDKERLHRKGNGNGGQATIEQG